MFRPSLCQQFKVSKYCNHKKLASPYNYWAYEYYFPQLCLYFLPLPHGDLLKQPSNFLLENWTFLLVGFNNLLLNCKKGMPNFLTMQFKLI